MISQHRILKLLCLMALVTAALNTPARDAAKTDTSSCRQFADDFYKWYVPLARKPLDRPAFEVAIEREPAVFAPELVRLLKADWDAQQRAKDDIVGIDFDPFVGAQDPAGRYETRNISVKESKCRIELWGYSPHARPPAAPDVVAEASMHDGKWLFENFVYPDLKTDLLATLASLRKERGEQ